MTLGPRVNPSRLRTRAIYLTGAFARTFKFARWLFFIWRCFVPVRFAHAEAPPSRCRVKKGRWLKRCPVRPS